MNKIKLHLNYAGYCWSKENHALRTGRNKQIKFHALWGLIKHPSQGYILYDTGYAERFYKATVSFPNKIYAIVTKVVVTKEDEIASQLKAHNIDPKEIKHIILTHFHADHIGGLMDFPNAKIYTSSVALEHTLALKDAFAFSKGVLKSMIPDDIKERAILVDKKCSKIEDPIFGESYDLFGDNSIHIINLPGHAAGQTGVIVKTNKSKYLLVSDACWLKESIEDEILPSPIVKLFFHSWNQYINTLDRIQQYYKQHTETIIVPTHCFETTKSLVNNKISFDVL